jgi:autotransporter-associated beta strand protein
VSTNAFPADGTVNFNGLLDNVQFYNQALSAQQVATLYQGNNPFGSLPPSTNVTIASGATLDLNGALQQIGSLTGVAGSTVALGSGRLIVNSSSNTQFAGIISGVGGSLVKQGAGKLTLTGTIAYTGATLLNGGALSVNGSLAGPVTVNNTGALLGTGNISGLVNVASGGMLTPGNSAGALTIASLALDAGSQTQIELAGTARGSQYDAVLVGGSASLGGALNVSLLGGFMPSLSDRFDIIDWGTRTGMFQNVNLPALSGGLGWNTSQLYSQGALIVVSGLAGDYNNDGTVSAADYTVWRNNLGALAGTLLNDVDGAPIGRAQYDTWKANYGLSLPGSGSHTATIVPEPASAVTLVTMIALLCCRVRPRHG